MKIYSLEYCGFEPIGAVLITIAENKDRAFELAIKEIQEMKLEADNKNLTVNNLIEINTESEKVIILHDGNY